ncbi:MAG: phosphoglucomutase/phosphomannomutase family protein [Erysipelothrix sp.]|nr:phosphoglucomutase/phosphomannomutase family protein [Erysipelothrix sp.]
MIKFGTGGWRSIIGEDFTKANIQILTQALCDLQKDKRIVIGYDRRFLSDIAARWAAEVFAGNGVEVLFISKPSPTPMIMFAVEKLKTQFGMAITASHNPAHYNGIKIFTSGGRDASEELTEAIEKNLQKNSVRTLDFDQGIQSGKIKELYVFNDYIDSILSMIDTSAISKRNLRILVDPMHGVSRTSLSTILLTARCDVDIINERHDTLFGGKLPSPASNTLNKLKDMVKNHHYDLGIATDGDADRIGIVDDKGNFIHPNLLLAILYYYLLTYRKLHGAVIRNLSTTHLLDRIADHYGEQCIEVPVGFKHISSGMEQYDALIGGESSGGLTIRGHIKGKDGIFAAALLVEIIATTNKKISEILDEIYEKFGYLTSVAADYRFSFEKKEQLTQLLFVDKKTPNFSICVDRISYMDGLKVYFVNGGWLSVRFSGTEPLIRAFCEMPSEELAEECLSDFEKFADIMSL